MAVRYSGDVETRSTYDLDERGWWVTVRSPKERWKGFFSGPRALDSAGQDSLARAAIASAEARLHTDLPVTRSRNRIEILRVFQAPCPCDHPVEKKGKKREAIRKRGHIREKRL